MVTRWLCGPMNIFVRLLSLTITSEEQALEVYVVSCHS